MCLKEVAGKEPASKAWRRLNVLLLLAYSFLMLWYTLLGRELNGATPRPEFLWSYSAWLSGNWSVGGQVILNVLMLVPVGFGLASLFRRSGILVAALLFSVSIEVLQLLTMRGTFEFDDIFNNTLGAIVGWLIYSKTETRFATLALAVSVLVLIIPCAISGGVKGNTSRILCFQVGDDGDGFAFLYGKDTPQCCVIALRSTETGEIKRLDVKTGCARPDVDAYFNCDYDYSWCGFQVDADIEGEWEYYVIAGPLLLIPTGTYVSGQGVHHVPEEEFEPPELDEEFVRLGMPLVWRPDEHCWVYQHGGCLYWVVDESFHFEEDGLTYIQYQLWTTRPDRLPHVRIEDGWDWDNIGGNFEDYELKGDFGRYRVMRRHLPTAYPVTSVMTGYYVDERWAWQECFRPVWNFE